MNVEWKSANIIPEDMMPILISFEDCKYPEIGYYSAFDGKYWVEREELTVLSDDVSIDDTAAEKIGKVNGWIPLPTCKDWREQA